MTVTDADADGLTGADGPTPADDLTPWAASLPADRGWRGQVVGVWHIAFGIVVLVSGLLTASRGAPAVAYVALGVYALAYFTLLAPIMSGGRPEGPAAYAFLAVSYATVVVIGLTAPHGLIILYVVFPHCVAILDRGWAKVSAVALVAVTAGVCSVVHDGTGGGQIADAAITVGVAVLTSLGLGFVTTVLIRESERRGRLIQELERTRAALAASHHEAGVLTERQRMAQEIHDTLAQGFTSILMLLQAADASLDTDPEGTRRRLDLAARTARENLTEARALVAAQDPAELDGGSLHDALGRAVAGLAEELDVAAEFRVAGTPRDLPATTQVVLVRTLQECLANIRKHADATAVSAELAYRPVGVRLTVTDDGRGFAPAETAPGTGTTGAGTGTAAGGYGLRGMRARIEQARGRLDLDSAPGAGTTVRVEVP
ncbi:sensor histidine kinase [Yinghuangia seranimata]|uniref:sensor histidine kinase n=1 Tax=Yinghuangia seranimata TaxID=408067 RepID=UPI00248AA707|nr:sensor histidine kinase [Yinghuangia seranimata]MDI2130247.1 sensor histidine kinase [Yinghuangia seranimata]